MKLISLIRSDLQRIERPSVKSFLRWYIYPQGSTFPYQVWLRIVHASQKNKFIRYSLGIIIYFIFRKFAFLYDIHVSTHLEIGPGLRIIHGSGVFLNCRSIGSNFTVYQGVTLGTGSNEDIPTICNDVTIYPGSIIYGGITLNDGCVVGANSVINKTVEEKVFVAGSPGKVIKRIQ